jgi:CRP/FNR family cyclic AMP-dependent transcriptional regulator
MKNSSSEFDKPVFYEKGSVIFVEGEPSLYLYIVLDGEVRVFKESKDRLLALSVIGEKDFLGELAMFDDSLRSATAVATKDTHLLIIKKSDISHVLKNCPEWITNIMITLSDRLKHSNEMLREHRIVDESLEMHSELRPEEEGMIRDAISEFRERKGLQLS